MGRLLPREQLSLLTLKATNDERNEGKLSAIAGKTAIASIGHRQAHTTPTAAGDDSSQQSLPRQPVPTLSRTILHFLAFNHAFSKKTCRSAKEAKRIAEAYQVCYELASDPQVTELQHRLEERAATLINWLTPWWLNVAYLEARTPLPIVTSPGVMLPDFPDYAPNRAGQVELAINLIHANVTFLRRVVRGQLPTDRTGGGEPLDMSQYERLFATTRLPRRQCDVIKLGSHMSKWPTHALVVHNGHSFHFPVMTADLKPLPRELLRRQFADVFAQSAHANPHPVNICSADERNAWADVYRRLDGSNVKELLYVEEALFVLGLDRSVNDARFSRSSQKLRQCLHGGGSRQNTPNRWFDKTLQFAISERCEAAVTYEHTPAEGPPLAALLDYVVDYVMRQARGAPADETVATDANVSAEDSSGVWRMDFHIDDFIEAAIRKASHNIDTAIDNLEIIYYKFENYGKNVPKRAKVSPDSMIQIAMQLAFYRLHHCHAPTYETATLRRFAEGRTETLRLPNDASVAFVEAAADGAVEDSDAELRQLLHDAIRAHKNYGALAMSGLGMDRHLLGLRLMAVECNQPTPALFASKAYQRLMHFRLSTSQVPTRNDMAMCFGPSAIDCYGVCYNPQETHIGFTISAYNNCAETSAVRFAVELEKALCDMRTILNDDAQKPSKI